MRQSLNNMFNQSTLKSILSYNENTGLFVWLDCKTRARRNGKIAGTLTKNKRIHITINKKRFYAHRLAWLYVYGIWPVNFIDHINGIFDDNRIVNLRECNRLENQQNIRKPTKSNKSGYLGVSYDKKLNKFKVGIGINYKVKYLGYYESAKEASEVYLKAKRELHQFCTI